MPCEHEAPAEQLEVAVARSPIASNRQVLAFGMVGNHVELHVKVVFVVDVRMMRKRDDRNLYEIAEDDSPMVDDVREELLESDGFADDGDVQIPLRLFQCRSCPAIDFRYHPSTPSAGIDARREEIVVDARH